jgi:hypothetical protein
VDERKFYREKMKIIKNPFDMKERVQSLKEEAPQKDIPRPNNEVQQTKPK